MTALYNDNDPIACAILAQQIHDGVVAPGMVDPTSIKELNEHDVVGFTQCHFFAGGGLWSVALRQAGWADDRPVWTASCPCQPFSAAGKGAGFDDDRHLWPDLFRLVRAGRPAVLVGEQVADTPGYRWFDRVAADLEGEGYAVRAVDFPACAVNAPQIRQRLYWVALARSVRGGRDGRQKDSRRQAVERVAVERPHGGYWADATHIDCPDGARRRTKPGLPMLVDGISGSVAVRRVAGNAIVPEAAVQVIASLMDVLDGVPANDNRPLTTECAA